MLESIGIVGAGRVARALGRLLADAGEPVAYVAGRNIQHAADAASFIGTKVKAVPLDDLPDSVSKWLIAVPDCALTGVAATLAGRSSARVALHTCGARGIEALAPLHESGTACGTLHPLQTITGDSSSVAALRGVAFAISGDDAALRWAERIVSLAQGHVLRIQNEFRPLYHAAAVMAGNYVMALLDAARTLLVQCGVESDTALRSLAPLIRTSVENALARGPEEALTGPIERGDTDTVAAHLAALASLPSSIQNLYRAAGLQTVQLARRRKLDAHRAAELERCLS